jgi:mono/diheme cytochrome c family protein
VQQEPAPKQTISRWPLVIAGGVFAVILLVFIVEFITLSGKEGGLDEDAITADSYMDVVEPLLANADPARGYEIMELRGCTVCHGNQNLAPSIDIIQANAAERRLPLQPEAYIYESIIHPGAFIVQGFQNNMPRIYEETLPADELGHIIAYLSGRGGDSDSSQVPSEQPPAIIIPEMTEGDGIPLTEELVRQYEDVAVFLLTGADAQRGEFLVEDYGCNVCHGGAAAGILAPTYTDTVLYGEQRRPPLSLAAYVYESIVFPANYVGEGWTNTMALDYDEIISSRELGDMIAYILSYTDD